MRAILRQNPSLFSLSEPITSAMVDFYIQSQVRYNFPHYVCISTFIGTIYSR